MSETQDQVQDTEQKKEAKKDIAIVDGNIETSTLSEEYRLASLLIQSEMLPKWYKTPAQVMIARQFLASLGFKAIISLKNVAIINGTPSLFGDAALALPMASGKIKKLIINRLDKEQKVICLMNQNLFSEVFAVHVVIERNDIIGENEFVFSIDDAKQAMLFKNDVWNKHTTIMLTRRALQQAFKSTCSDILSQISFSEYEHNLAPDLQQLKDVQYTREGTTDGASVMNEALNAPV